MTAFTYGTRLLGADGQSLQLQPSATESVPALIQAAYPKILKRVPAQGGTNYPTRTLDAPQRVDRLLSGVHGLTVLYDCAGQTDINNGYSAANIITNMEAYWDARRDAGWAVIVAATIPDAGSFDAGEDVIRATVNDAIEASTYLDDFVDLRVDAFLEDASNNPTYWQGDFLHPTAAGADLIASYAIPVLAPWLA